MVKRPANSRQARPGLRLKEAAHEQDDFDAIDAMIDEMRERTMAADGLLADHQTDEADDEGG